MKVNIPGESTPDLFLIMWGPLRRKNGTSWDLKNRRAIGLWQIGQRRWQKVILANELRKSWQW